MLPRLLTAAVTVLSLAVAVLPGRATAADDPAVVGRFLPRFEEPTVAGQRTDEDCVESSGHGDERDRLVCKPAAASMAMLANGDVVYWNALEGTENVQHSIALEFGRAAVDDQARVLDLDLRRPGRSRWRVPRPPTGGGRNRGGTYVLPEELVRDPRYNDASMFCTDLVFLADGRVLIAGGTDYYAEPSVGDSGFGLVELEGMRTARVFDPRTDRFARTGRMHYGRWYPSLVTLGSGKVLAASGVTKLIKTLYPDRPPTESGTNVHQTETYDPRSGRWRRNPESASRSLPLYPRLHLLPNGDVLYAAGGQVFNPNGYSYDEALWNVAAAYDPRDRSWTDLGVPGLGASEAFGFRGSTFSALLTLRPDARGRYRTARVLQAGGVVGTSPGAYVATTDSRILTVDASQDTPVMTTEATGDLNAARWYGSAVVLPDGKVFAVNGADRDEVVAPGTGFPTKVAELFDPRTKTWQKVAEQPQGRTYHNSALLLPDGRVLVGGHAPISTLYGANRTLPGGFSANDGRDPSLEIYEPPYLHYGVDRPVITDAPRVVRHRRTFTVEVSGRAARISSVVLVRNPSVTHLVDSDQRSVELRVVGRRGRTLTVAAPPGGDVAPDGPYMLFVNRRSRQGEVPSVSRQVFVR